MVAYLIPERVKLSLTPAFATAVGVSVALVCMLVPSGILETAMLESGIPALIPAAEPPLGWTARTALAMITGSGAAAAAWLAAFLLLGGDGAIAIAPRSPKLQPLPKMPARIRARTAAKGFAVPVLRRADAHPDAPPRAPLLALRDLGVPFLDVRAPAVRDLPNDLDAPLSDFDPDAIPDRPAAPIRAVASLHAVPNPANQDEGERFEAFQLSPPAQPPLTQAPIAAPRTDATVHALLDRLERGVGARPPVSPIDTLSELRRLATR